MDQKELDKRLALHKKWLSREDGGERLALRGEDLRRSNLRRSDLRRSDLSGSDLSGSDLSRSNLSGSDLRRSNLRRSDLRRSDLSGSNLSGSDLRFANTQNAVGHLAIGVQVNTSRPNNLITYYPDLGIVTTGCFQGTMDELEKRVAYTHKNNPFLRERYERAIAFLKNEWEEEKKNREKEA